MLRCRALSSVKKAAASRRTAQPVAIIVLAGLPVAMVPLFPVISSTISLYLYICIPTSQRVTCKLPKRRLKLTGSPFLGSYFSRLDERVPWTSNTAWACSGQLFQTNNKHPGNYHRFWIIALDFYARIFPG